MEPRLNSVFRCCQVSVNKTVKLQQRQNACTAVIVA